MDHDDQAGGNTVKLRQMRLRMPGGVN